MNDIERWPGGAAGRSRVVCWNGMVWTVAVASDRSADIGTQTAECLAALDRNLAEAGSDRTRLLSAQVFLADLADKPAMDAEWNRWIGPDPEHWPQRACVGAELERGTLVEIVLLAACRAG